MRRTKKKKAKILRIVFAFAVLSAAAVIIFEPHAHFAATDTLRRIKANEKAAEMLTLNIETAEYTLTELENDERVTFDNSLMLINTDHLLPPNYDADIAEYGDSEVFMSSCAVESFGKLCADVAEKFGENLYVADDYRTADEQAELIRSEGSTAQKLNASEHQAGLALDVFRLYCAGVHFPTSDMGKFVDTECGNYGFIMRYPWYGIIKTGIEYEPWHIRYVGMPHAKIINSSLTTLESYIESYEPGKFYTYGDYTITRQKGETFILPADFGSAVISPDNTGTYIITMQ